MNFPFSVFPQPNATRIRDFRCSLHRISLARQLIKSFMQFCVANSTLFAAFCNFSRISSRFPVFMSQKLAEINLEGGWNGWKLAGMRRICFSVLAKDAGKRRRNKKKKRRLSLFPLLQLTNFFFYSIVNNHKQSTFTLLCSTQFSSIYQIYDSPKQNWPRQLFNVSCGWWTI